MHIESMSECLKAITTVKWSTDNLAFGSGGALLQDHTRDEQKFAFKASSAVVNGERRDVWKKPITDPGKNSKRGRLALIRNTDGNLETIIDNERTMEGENLLQPVFEDGKLVTDWHLSDVRKLAEITT